MATQPIASSIASLSAACQVRSFERNSDEFFTALHLALNVRRPPNRFIAPEIRSLLHDARQRNLDINPVLGAFDHTDCLGVAVLIQAPGASAMLFVGLIAKDQATRIAAGASLADAARRIAQARNVRLVQVLIAPNSHELPEIAKAAGFRLMTQLIYLRREHHASKTTSNAANDLTWESIRPDNQSSFFRAIELSYAESLDCPELIGLRETSDILATHRASGEFLDDCWWVAKRENEPVGVILLNGVREPFGLEVVYMGVAQIARGTGVADALLARAVECCVDKSARYLTLAVDKRNTPAKSFYARWDFVETHRMDAWITTHPHT